MIAFFSSNIFVSNVSNKQTIRTKDMINQIQKEITPIKRQLVEHPVYQLIKSKEDVQLFMEIHVYAVWDFMSLLKVLQQQLSCISLPWRPVENASIARFINEIVLGEETDIDQNGDAKSHYELYVDAMKSIGASSEAIEQFVESASSISQILAILKKDETLPMGVRRFLSFTFNLIQTAKPHQLAAAFTFGREDLIPDLFTSIINGLDNHDGSIDPLLYYLERHIELDGDDHGPLSLQMVELLCGDDEQKWEEAKEIAFESLRIRLVLWDEIYAKLVDSQLTLGISS